MLKSFVRTLLSALALPSPVAIAEKALIAEWSETEPGSGRCVRYSFYVEPSSIRRHGPHVYWKDEMIARTTDGELRDRYTVIRSANCDAPHEYRVHSETFHTIDGRSVNVTNACGDSGPLEKVVFGSAVESVVSYVCATGKHLAPNSHPGPCRR